MSDSSTPIIVDTTPAPADAATAITAEGAAPVEGQGGQEQPQTPEAGQGEAGDTPAGQGAGDGEAAEGGASAEGETPEGDEGGDASGAPEQYAAFNLPEGYELSGEMLDGVTSFAKAHNLNQEQAQAIVDLGAQQAQAIIGQITEQALANPVMLAQHWAGEWSKQTAADAELGGNNLRTTMALATKVFATFATPELGEFLTKTGLAHHPELIRFMHKIGKAVSEDTLVMPQGGQSQEPPGRNPARKLYPGMK